MHIYSLQFKREFIEYILCVLHVVENPGITTIFEVSTNLPISTSDRIRDAVIYVLADFVR